MHAWNTQYEAAVAGELEERVKRWQESIQPHLEAQDKHPSFDIQSYGEAIVDTLKAKVSCVLVGASLVHVSMNADTSMSRQCNFWWSQTTTALG